MMDNRTEYYLNTVEEADRHKLADLKPSSLSYMPEDTQGKIIKIIQDDPTGGYAFLSPSGWSKSTFLSALFHQALCRQPDHLFDYSHRSHRGFGGYTPVVMIDASRLLSQIEAWRYREGDTPIITVGKIERMVKNDVFFTLILDEFEKIRKTPFRMEESYNLINACYKARGKCQFIMAGNLTKDDLRDVNQFQEGTFRRVEALTTTKEGKTHFWEFGRK
jgi:hypothetical protein